MTDTQLRDETLTIFLAGYETVANALSWTWYLLSQNPEAADKMYAEVDEVLGGTTATAGKLSGAEVYGDGVCGIDAAVSAGVGDGAAVDLPWSWGLTGFRRGRIFSLANT
jgi:hypothetical protein